MSSSLQLSLSGLLSERRDLLARQIALTRAWLEHVSLQARRAEAHVVRWCERVRIARVLGGSELLDVAREQLVDHLVFLDELVAAGSEFRSELALQARSFERIQADMLDLWRHWATFLPRFPKPQLLPLPRTPDDAARRRVEAVVARTGHLVEPCRGGGRGRRARAEALWEEAERRPRQN